ncbi:A disintegrin and metalloproteinase with thrombospondin motifs 18-like isoform X2 [Daphnia pulicaria]|uniref:A disintegrin and metalloproteinase with thrombospondin motifs 18-like isoform X2 n=1 Tax=Daphnia pulicaria TaxID=35523 RepID=UPI001EEA0FA9|nr:A disintegrin and metalloproteinase with thrombospondin motifs 18-like isoform X2 [Daphnia pulicaria]
MSYTRIYLAVAFLYLATVQLPFSAANNQVHHDMTPDELRRVFHVDSHDQVPTYEVINLRSRVRRDAERDIRHVDLSAFGTRYNLRLERNEQLLRGGNKVRVWVADSPSTDEFGGNRTGSTQFGGITLEELPQDDDVGTVYQDEDTMAAVLVNHDAEDDALILDGTIGSELVIRPLPVKHRKLQQKSAGVQLQSGSHDDEMFMDEEDFRSADFMTPSPPSTLPPANDTENALIRKKRSLYDLKHSVGSHVVYKRAAIQSDDDYAFMEMDLPPTGKSQRMPRTKRSAPPTIYPEILVIVDYDGYRLHNGDNAEIKKYFVSFWNGVDLRYKLLKGPKVRISIAGIIISRGRDATPYFEKNRVGRNAIDSTAALTDMGKYLFQERRLPVYDIAVAITKFDMCRRRKSGRCANGTAGFAYVGGACVVNKRLEKVNSVAIVEDTGGFSGIIVAAHEVGHLLGSVHDGSPPPSYLGGPGAQRCRWEDGYIMSDLRHTDRGFKWSSCSIAQFDHFLNGETATCLFNSPHEDAVLPRVLPGKLLSLDAQCRMDRGTSACFKDDRVCAQLFCFDASSGYCVSYRPAAEGSSCGDGQICNNGRCIVENENAIPDYAEDIGLNSFLKRTDTILAATEAKPFYSGGVASTAHVFNPTTPKTTTTTTKATTITTRATTTTAKATTTATTTTTTSKPLITTVPWWHTSSKSSTPSTRWWNNWTKRSTPSSVDPQVTNTQPAASSLSLAPSTIPATTAVTTPRPTISVTRFRPTTTSTTTTTTTTTPRTTSRTTAAPSPVSNKFSSSGVNELCEDRITKIAGSMSCQDFLQRYGFQYCRQPYIMKNCCASQQRYCPN